MDKIYNHNRDAKPFKFGKEADNALATLKNLNQVIDAVNASGGIYKAGMILSGHKVVMVSLGEAVYYDPTNDSNIGKHLGITLHAAVAGDDVSVADEGVVNNPGWGLIQDAIYYIAPIGGITSIVPTSGVLQRVGVAIDPDNLKIDFSEPISLI